MYNKNRKCENVKFKIIVQKIDTNNDEVLSTNEKVIDDNIDFARINNSKIINEFRRNLDQIEKSSHSCVQFLKNTIAEELSNCQEDGKNSPCRRVFFYTPINETVALSPLFPPS